MWPVILFILTLFLFCACTNQPQTSYLGGGRNKLSEENAISTIDTFIRKHNNSEYFFFSQLPKNLPYNLIKIYKPNHHIGQRKLLLNEIQFFSAFMNMNGGNELIIYVGAAPCEHLSFIKELFPNKKYLLIDPNFVIVNELITLIYQNPNLDLTNAKKILKHYKKNGSAVQKKAVMRLKTANNFYSDSHVDLENPSLTQIEEFQEHYEDIIQNIMSSPNDIFVIQDYMTIELCYKLKASLEVYQPKLDVYFISDLRSNMFSNSPLDMDIIFNDYLQALCIKILQPTYSMLKFHTPYFADSSIHTYLQNPNAYPAIQSVVNNMKDEFNLDVFEMASKKKYMHFENETILLQPWAPKGSSEARLIIHKSSLSKPLVNYDQVEWDNALGFANLFRTYGYTSWKVDIDKYRSKEEMYDSGYDCAIEIAIIQYYLNQKQMQKKFTEKSFTEAFKNVDRKKLHQFHQRLQKHLRWDIHVLQKVRPKPIFNYAHSINRYFYTQEKSIVLPTNSSLPKLDISDSPLNQKINFSEF